MRRRNEKKAERESGSGGVGGGRGWGECISKRLHRNHRPLVAKRGTPKSANIAYARRGRDDGTLEQF